MKIRLRVHDAEFNGACILKVLVGTEAPTKSNDSVTIIELENLGGCQIQILAKDDTGKSIKLDNIEKLRITLFGDSEAENIMKAARFIAEVLKKQMKDNATAKEIYIEVD